MKKRDYLFYTLGILLLFIIWFFSSIITNQELILPKISSVFKELGLLLIKKDIYLAIYGSFIRVLLGFTISLIVGIFLGVLANRFRFFELLFKPMYLIVKNVPTASVLLLLLIMVGFSKTPLILLLIVTIPIIYQSTIYGFQTISNDIKDINKLDNANNLMNFFQVILPLVLPSIINGVIIAIGVGIKAEVMAEILSGSTKNNGIGLLLKYARDNLEIAKLFAITILFIIITIFIEQTMSFLHKKYQITY
ncbi:MAG: ABC transporter permease subunit [Bacillales bacterium]|jgi:NitT/TauT family transport system permease protein|nr:ABC transporter permease subunit [Bacillales bacterium]